MKTKSSSSPPLTTEQMDQICGILAVGCDRETAAGVVECSLLDIGRAIADDPGFAVRVHRAEATAEWRHMENVLKTTKSKDGKYWRASVWWLERHSPERFARRSPGAITPRQFQQAVAAWNDVLQKRFHTPADQQRIAASFEEITATIELLLDAQSAATLLKRQPPPLPLDNAPANDPNPPATHEATGTSGPAQP